MKPYKLYNILSTAAITIMLSCDCLAFSTVDIFGFRLAASGFIFPASFFVLSIITNSYGYKMAGRVIWSMMGAQLTFILVVTSVVHLSTPDVSIKQQAYFTLYHDFWRVILASNIAVPLSYFVNDYLISKLKLKLRVYWLIQNVIFRFFLSAMISNFILVSISYPINFWGLISFKAICLMAGTTWIFKMIAVLLLLPFIYPLTSLVKKFDAADEFDYNISYNPFHVFSGGYHAKNHTT
jgi:uncharacterized integral membrane protein (TIGR00697 family)